MSLQPRKIEIIQVYRGLAAFAVLLYHVGRYGRSSLECHALARIFWFGITGVDFFFVLSGFIIFFVHRCDIGVAPKVVPYLKKRFVRIYPLWWVMSSLKVLALLSIGSLASSYKIEPVPLVKSFLLVPQEQYPV